MNKVLSEPEIHQLLNRIRESNYTARWPGNEDKKKILEAIKTKQSEVDLEGGKFKISYSEGKKFPTSGETHSTAFLKPVGESFVPCGWFSERELKKELQDG